MINIELTKRQQKALTLLAEGKLVKDLAEPLSISQSNVYVFLAKIRARLGATTNTHAVVIAISLNIIEA